MIIIYTLRKLTRAIEFTAKLASGLLVMAILLIMTSQIFFRYILNSSLQWSEELSVWLMIWTVFIGAVLLIKNWEHIFIPTIIRLFPLKIRSLLIIFSKILVLIFLIVLTIYGWKVFTGPSNAFSFNVGLSTAWAKLAIPVGCTFMIIGVLSQIIDDIISFSSGKLANFEKFGRLDNSSANL